MERKGRDHRHAGGRAPTWRKRTPRRTPCKNVVTSAFESFSGGARFEFQNRLARIDWRTLHTIDVDRVIREVDINTLESVLDTVAFGDIQGEDTRNFTETNFVKIFRLAQLMVEYLLHVQDLLADHKSGLLQSRANMEQQNEKIRSRFLRQRDALLQTRHELKQAKKTVKTYEVMLKVQEKNNQTSQSTEPQVFHCSVCEKAFESSYYLDLHVARKHQNKQEVMDDKILAVVSTAEEATAARVKAEMSSVVQAEIQQLRERYQADLQRAETNSNTQVRELQEDLRQSNNRLHEVQSRLEALQAQVLSVSPNNSRLGSLHAVEKSKGKYHGPNQERLHELESKFSGLDCQVKTLGQENSRLLKELNVAYAEVSDLQSAKRQRDFALQTQIDDLRKENQQLKRTMSKVNNMAVQVGFMSNKPDELNKLKAHCQSPSVGPSLVQPSNKLNNSRVVEDRFSLVHQSPSSGRPEASMSLKKIKFRGGVMLTNMIEDEPVALSMYKERRGFAPRERWTDKDEALRALARPTSGRRRTETIPEEPSEGESSPDPERYTNSRSPVKRALRFLTPERMRLSFKERPKSAASKKIKLRGGGDNPTTVEEMRGNLEWEKAAAHEEQKKRQKSVQQFPAKELVKKKRNKGNRTKCEDTGSCKLATQCSYTSKSETPSKSIAPLLLALRKNLETISPSSTIHTLRKIVSNRAEIERIQPKLGPLPGTWIQPFHSRPPYKPGPCCKRPLHPYLRLGIGNPQPQPQPRTSFHMAVLSGNPDLKNITRNRISNHTVPPSKEHIIERLSAVTRELGKYFPTEKPKVKCGTSGSAQLTIPDIETTETETTETEEDQAEKRTTPHEDEKIPRMQEISEVAAMDVGEVAQTKPIPETQTGTKTETHEETGNDFSGQLRKELKKFGIASTANGISDTTYKSISSALEKQRSARMFKIHGDERQIVEYERNAVLWHTQVAVRDRDLVIAKSPFNVVADSGSDCSNASEDSVEESGRSKKSNESCSESREDSRERDMKPGGASDVRSSEQSSPQSGQSSDDTQEASVSTYKSKNVNWAKHSKADGSVHVGSRSPCPKGRVQYVSRTYSWEPTLKQANFSRNNRDPPSRGELIRSITDVIDHTRQSEEEEVDEDAFGLGDWDSDEDTGKQRSLKRKGVWVTLFIPCGLYITIPSEVYRC